MVNLGTYNASQQRTRVHTSKMITKINTVNATF